MTTPRIRVFLLIFVSSVCLAKSMPQPPSCEEPAQGKTLMVPQFTGYAPSLGGINGSCKGGASRRLGFVACKNTLHNFKKGKADFVMLATQQYGGSANLFGCWGRTEGFQSRRINLGDHSCHTVALVDHYAKSENAGGVGINGRRTGTKVDVEVSKLDQDYSKLGRRTPAQIQCVARVRGVTNREKPSGKISVKRKPKAQKRYYSWF